MKSLISQALARNSGSRHPPLRNHTPMGLFSKTSKLGSTPSHGNPPSTNALNTELNNVARNTNDTAKARALVEQGADLSSTNGPAWRHTPLHQAAYHGRFEMAKTLVELGAPLHLHSNPCGRGATGTPYEVCTRDSSSSFTPQDFARPLSTPSSNPILSACSWWGAS